MSTLTLPSLDLNNTDLVALGACFRRAAETHGFLQVKGHGMCPNLILSAFEMAKKFFDMPLEDKVALQRDPKTNRGYEVLGMQCEHLLS